MIKPTLVLLCLFAGLNMALADEVLTTTSTDTWGLLSDQKMVYMDYHYLTATTFWAEILMVDLATKAKTALYPTENKTYPYYLSYGFSGSHLAYVPYLSSGGSGGYAGGATCNLNYKNIATGASRQLTTNTAWKEMVWVGGDVVVWVDYRYRVALTLDSLNSEIFLYDLVSNQEQRLTSDHAYQGYPCTDGQSVAWIDYSGAYGKLMLHTIATGETKEIAPYDAGKNNPRICGNYVVWEDYRNVGNDPKNVDLYLYDITTDVVSPVCLAPGFQGRLYIEGTKVVWEDYRNATIADPSNADIYGYDIVNRQESPLVTGVGYQAHPTLYGNRLCWMDKNAGIMTLQLTEWITSASESMPIATLTGPSLYLSVAGKVRIQGIFTESSVRVQVLDLSGKIIANGHCTGIGNGYSEIPLHRSLRPGVYALRLHIGNNKTMHKVIAW